MSDQTYDDSRARNLETLLRALAARIGELDRKASLLQHASELQRLLGDVRSELFHYEVRCTYDTPEVADHRRLIAEAEGTHEETWQNNPWTPEKGEGPAW